MKLHPTQERIIAFINKNGGSIENMPLRDIGESAGVGRQPQVIAHHLQQLEKKGYLRRDPANKNRITVLMAPIADVAYINLYGMAQCGPEGFFADDCVIDRIPLPTKTFGISDPTKYFLVTARGRSMEPMIKEGDLVLVAQRDDVDSGSVAVVLHEGVPKIKKVVVNESGGRRLYSLVSFNDEFPDENIGDESVDFRILGLVKGVIHTPNKSKK
jgi:repressor LexA